MSTRPGETLIETHNKSRLSHLEHVFGFQLIEGHVIEVVKRFRMNSRKWSGFEVRPRKVNSM